MYEIIIVVIRSVENLYFKLPVQLGREVIYPMYEIIIVVIRSVGNLYFKLPVQLGSAKEVPY